MKKAHLKTIISCILAIILFASVLPLPAFAANKALHMVLGVGRSSAIVQSSSGVKIDRIEKGDDPRSFLVVPLIDGGSTYVPFRYIMETAGFSIDYESASGTIVIRSMGGGAFPFWVEDPVRGAKKIAVTRIDYKDDVFTVTALEEGEPERIQLAPSKTFFGRTYIPVRELERFEFIIHWDGAYNMVHIVSETTVAFQTAFEDYFKEKNATYRGAKASSYINGMDKIDAYYYMYERYISCGAEFGNSTNNSLALRTPDGLFISTVSDSKKNEYTSVAGGSRQLTYTTADNKRTVYYILNSDKQIYKADIIGKERIGDQTRVAMPEELANKKFSQLIINYDRLFFIAYDNAQSGGNVYMAQIGDEKNSAVRLTENKVWNIALSADYRLYYTDFEKKCALYAINLKDAANLATLYNDGSVGLDGVLQANIKVQSFAMSQKSSDIYYYSDVATGAIMEATHSAGGGLDTKVLIKPASASTLFNFLNLYEASDGKVLYYIEYANGMQNNYDSCKIMAYNLVTGETKEVYLSNRMIMQLTVVGKSIYFTNADYSKLYKFDVTETGFVFTEY
ncbi:MAG: copper amine oxidase N-terminal domain-containing protein [Oscillospiraceae bacterium]|jgi:hypothetical protein|nr:copper amine oxidase N-terminal domain-containing protein [Oscillospiraceae bacterium]